MHLTHAMPHYTCILHIYIIIDVRIFYHACCCLCDVTLVILRWGVLCKVALCYVRFIGAVLCHKDLYVIYVAVNMLGFIMLSYVTVHFIMSWIRVL